MSEFDQIKSQHVPSAPEPCRTRSWRAPMSEVAYLGEVAIPDEWLDDFVEDAPSRSAAQKRRDLRRQEIMRDSIRFRLDRILSNSEKAD